MIAWNDIMVQYQLHLMSRRDQLHTLPVTRRLQSPDSITHIVVKLFYLLLWLHNRRHLAQVTAQLLRFHLQLLLLITSRIVPLQPPCLLFFIPRDDVVYLLRQCLLTANALPHHPFQWSPASVHLPETFSLPNQLRRKHLSFSLPHGFILSMVLLTISVSDSIVHNSPTVLQHSAPHSTSHLTFTLLLPLTFRSHPDLCVVPPNSNVNRSHYSKPSFLENSPKFCLLRRSHATTGNCKITNLPWSILLL